MVSFILFPGFGTSKYQWKYKFTFKDNHFIIEKCDFLDKLKQLGKVYTYTPKFNNAHKYNKDDEIGKYYDFDIDIDFNYLNLEKHCRIIYNEIKNKNLKSPYVVIGHSLGAYFAYKFTELYKEECVANFILDGTTIFEKYLKSVSPFTSNSELVKLIEKVDNKQFIQIIQNIKTLYKEDKNNHVEIGKFAQIVHFHLEKQAGSINKKFHTKTFLLSNLTIEGTDDQEMLRNMKWNISKIKNNNKLEKLNGNMIKIYYYINKTHDLYCTKTNNIIQIISKFLEMINQNGGYYHKYMKYKDKYLILKKNNIKGGNKLIIHIAGPQGSGKTTMGNKLSDKFKNKIHVKDLDELWSEYVQEYDQNNKIDYQKYIDNYINNYNNMPLIFVGLDADICLGPKEVKDNNEYYDFHTNYKYYIDNPVEVTLQQKFYRQVDKLYERKEQLFKNYIVQPKETQEKLIRYINIDEWRDDIKKCDKLYKTREHKFDSFDNIYNDIIAILNKSL